MEITTSIGVWTDTVTVESTVRRKFRSGVGFTVTGRATKVETFMTSFTSDRAQKGGLEGQIVHKIRSFCVEHFLLTSENVDNKSHNLHLRTSKNVDNNSNNLY